MRGLPLVDFLVFLRSGMIMPKFKKKKKINK
jgi:hypothetical protein